MAYAQVDFGEIVYLDESGRERKAYELIVSFPYSDKAYVQVLPSQNQECLLTGMRSVFEWFGARDSHTEQLPQDRMHHVGAAQLLSDIWSTDL